MDPHPDLRYRRTDTMLECRLRGARIAYASAMTDGRWELRCNDDDYPSWHDDYDAALREMVTWARRYAWAHTERR
ncbi:hypothetical protein [Lysobacter sp. HA18]